MLLALIALPKSAWFTYWEWPTQVILVGALSWFTWPTGVSLRPEHWLKSIAIGALVFVLWIGPELIDANYRHTFLFSNRLWHVGSSLSAEALRSPSVLFWRTVRASTVVPVAEELFWRAWLMRWLIHNDFHKVPLGAYAPMAFWVTALLFGAEHGAYWDVGLLTGVIYNYWMVRYKSLGDCILVHAVTNLTMSLYAIQLSQWQYWQ